MDFRERDAHQKTPHVSGHGRMAVDNPNDCVECGVSLLTKADLLRHAKEYPPQPYACDCGSAFSRLYVLNRHLRAFNFNTPQYPCKYYKRHRGQDGFRRLDHLRQHIRNHHHMNWITILQLDNMNRDFNTRSRSAHMLGALSAEMNSSNSSREAFRRRLSPLTHNRLSPNTCVKSTMNPHFLVIF